jgi:hypothetical protein
MIPADLPRTWRDRAGELRPYAPAAAVAWTRAADELEAALAAAADEELTLGEASSESGYSERRLRELLAEGAIPMAAGGRKGRPRILRRDLPRRAGAARAAPTGGYDADLDAAALLTRGVGQ